MKVRFSCSLAVPLAAILVLAGCGHPRYARSYVLSFPAAAPPVAPPPEIRGALAVDEFGCPQYLCEGRIVYRPGQEEIGFYEFHRWAANPREMIRQHLSDKIRSRALFKSVEREEPGVKPAYVLKGTIERLEEVDQGGEVHAICTISAQLIDTQTQSIIWSHTATQDVGVENRNVPGVVSSLSAAARMTVDEIVKSMEEGLLSASARRQ